MIAVDKCHFTNYGHVTDSLALYVTLLSCWLRFCYTRGVKCCDFSYFTMIPLKEKLLKKKIKKREVKKLALLKKKGIIKGNI